MADNEYHWQTDSGAVNFMVCVKVTPFKRFFEADCRSINSHMQLHLSCLCVYEDANLLGCYVSCQLTA